MVVCRPVRPVVSSTLRAARPCTGRCRPLSGQQARQLAALRSLLPANPTSDLQVLLEAIRYIGVLRQQLGVH